MKLIINTSFPLPHHQTSSLCCPTYSVGETINMPLIEVNVVDIHNERLGCDCGELHAIEITTTNYAPFAGRRNFSRVTNNLNRFVMLGVPNNQAFRQLVIHARDKCRQDNGLPPIGTANATIATIAAGLGGGASGSAAMQARQIQLMQQQMWMQQMAANTSATASAAPPAYNAVVSTQPAATAVVSTQPASNIGQRMKVALESNPTLVKLMFVGATFESTLADIRQKFGLAADTKITPTVGGAQVDDFRLVLESDVVMVNPDAVDV